MTRRRRHRWAGSVTGVRGAGPTIAVVTLTALAAAFVAGAVAAPWIAARTDLAGTVVRLLYRPLCHQLPDRCLDLGAGPVAVCARCLGLYAGGLAALLVVAITGRAWRPTGLALLAIAAPSVLDFGLGLVGLPSLPNGPRLVLAVPLGAALGSALACAAADGFGGGANRRPRDAVE